jgi:tetratricopeptide (TPR) repeat protein
MQQSKSTHRRSIQRKSTHRSTQRWFIASLGAALLAALLTPGYARAQDDWRFMRSENFYLVGDAGERAMRRVAERLEEFRAAYLSVRPVAGREVNDESTTVVVFENDYDFTPFKPVDTEGKPLNVGGLFLGTNYDSYIVLTGDDQSERSIYHEYSHRVSSEGTEWPLWLREGFAEFYSTLQVRDGGSVVRAGLSVPENLLTLRSSTLIPLDEFLEIGRDSSYYTRGLDQARFYAQSWALTHYLLLRRPNGASQLTDFLRRTGEGEDIGSSFEAAFGTDFNTMFRELDLYVDNSLTLPALDYRLSGEIEVEADWEAEDLPESEALYHLGEVLSRVDRDAEARQYLERSLAMNPDFARPLVRLAAMAETDGDMETAVGLLEQATTVSSPGYLTHLLLGQRLLTGPRSVGTAVADATRHLRRAVELNPEDPESIRWLGQALMSDPVNVFEAVSFLSDAVDTHDGDQDIALAYWRALWMAGDTDLAISGLGILANNATNRRIEQEARRLVSDIERYESMTGTVVIPVPVTAPPTSLEDTSPPLTRGPAAGRVTLVSGDRPEGGVVLGSDGMIVRLPVLAGTVDFAGRLVSIECRPDGARLRVEGNETTEEFHTLEPETIEFTSFQPGIQDSIECGPVSPSPRVLLSYVPGEGLPESLGEPRRVVFLPE